MRVEFTPSERCAFQDQYVHTALWSESWNTGVSFADKGFTVAFFSTDALLEAHAACDDFIDTYTDDLVAALKAGDDYTMGSAGHDFWLTRNGHGAGFWDRGLGQVGDRLAIAANGYGESSLYIGDDGHLHFG